jgi:hypothetical protein
MSQHPVRTARPSGFAKVTMAACLTGALFGCEPPPDGDVAAISGALMPIVQNATANDHVTGTVDMVFTISRIDPPVGQQASMFFSTMVIDGSGFTPATPGTSCTAGVDYIAVTNRLVTIPANSTSTTTTVTICGDATQEGVEHLGGHVVDAAGNCEGERCLAIGTIDDRPRLSIADMGVREPLSGGKTASFTVSLSEPATLPVTFTATPHNDTTSTPAGSCFTFPRPDYVGGARTLTIDAGQQTATVSVTVCGDGFAEPTERFFMDLSNATNAVISDGRANGTISDLTLQPLFP